MSIHLMLNINCDFDVHILLMFQCFVYNWTNLKSRSDLKLLEAYLYLEAHLCFLFPYPSYYLGLHVLSSDAFSSAVLNFFF